MLYHSPLFGFLYALKLSIFSYTDHYTVLVTCFDKDQKRRYSASALVPLSGSTQVPHLYLEAAATENNGQKKHSGNFVVAFNTKISHFVLDIKATAALSSSMQKSSVFST